MKKVLFATTALVGFAGAAFADGHEGVALSGSAEMGITYIDDGVADENVEFANDIDVTFTLSGSTPTGLTFGASIDLDESDGGAVIESANSVFIQGSFGTLSMGDIDGGYDKALANLGGAGLEDEGDQADGTSGLDGLADGEILRYDYAVSGLTLSGSVELEEGAVSNVYGAGIAYSGDFGGASLGVGLGVQYAEDNGAGAEDIIYGASVVLGFSSIEVTGVAQLRDTDGTEWTNFGIGAEYSANAVTVGVGYELTSADGADDVNLFQGYATYDLGGGAEVVAAASLVDNGTTEVVRAGFGLAFSF